MFLQAPPLMEIKILINSLKQNTYNLRAHDPGMIGLVPPKNISIRLLHLIPGYLKASQQNGSQIKQTLAGYFAKLIKFFLLINHFY